MPTAATAQVQIEAGQSLVAYVALTDSGDNTIFNPADNIMSGATGKEPSVRPNGITTGLNLLTPSTTAETVEVAAFSAWSKGVEYDVSAASPTFTRPTAGNVKKDSVTMTDAGVVAIVAGTENTTFASGRGVAGSAPYIPADSVELGQIWIDETSGVLLESEINQVPGTHAEYANFPVYTLNRIGDGISATENAKINCYLEFAAALPDDHTGDAPKNTWVQYYTPVFSPLQKATDFVPAEVSHSVSSQQLYGITVAASSETLGQGAFTALLDDGTTDSIVQSKNDILVVKFFPDRNKAPFILTQGLLGLTRAFPPGDQINAAVTITAETSSAEFSS